MYFLCTFVYTVNALVSIFITKWWLVSVTVCHLKFLACHFKKFELPAFMVDSPNMLILEKIASCVGRIVLFSCSLFFTLFEYQYSHTGNFTAKHVVVWYISMGKLDSKWFVISEEIWISLISMSSNKSVYVLLKKKYILLCV